MSKNDNNIIKEIYQKDRLKRILYLIGGMLIVSLAFNIFLMPSDIVLGVNGLSLIFRKLFGWDTSLVILIGSLILLALSFGLLGKEKTTKSIAGSLMFPLFLELTEWIIPYCELGSTEPILIAITGSIICGFGFGLVFKSGYTTGGTDILKQIISKYFKTSLGKAMVLTDGAIIMISFFVFGLQKFLYSVLTMYLISYMIDKVILGISQSKTFFIITECETAVKKFIMDHLSQGVTIIDSRGGYTGDFQKMIMCTIPTKEYFVLKEGLQNIDPNVFFIITDAYEVSGGTIK